MKCSVWKVRSWRGPLVVKLCGIRYVSQLAHIKFLEVSRMGLQFLWESLQVCHPYHLTSWCSTYLWVDRQILVTLSCQGSIRHVSTLRGKSLRSLSLLPLLTVKTIISVLVIRLMTQWLISQTTTSFWRVSLTRLIARSKSAWIINPSYRTLLALRVTVMRMKMEVLTIPRTKMTAKVHPRRPQMIQTRLVIRFRTQSRKRTTLPRSLSRTTTVWTS